MTENIDNSPHTPVMLKEVLEIMAPCVGHTYIDGTFGAGGYTRALLAAADCRVHAIDRDPDAADRAERLAAEFAPRLTFTCRPFGEMADFIAPQSAEGIVLDIGVSSMQIDQAARGFSFQKDGPLDMRMSQSGQSAADLVNTADEKMLADILFHFGEEKAARKIAKKIVTTRAEQPIRTTQDLAGLVHSVLPMHGGMKTDTATRTFQALRIAVNDELGELDRALQAAEYILKPGGKLVVVTFHSLEDAKVKSFFKQASGKEKAVSRHVPLPDKDAPFPRFTLPRGGKLKPSAAEISGNPRARSACLRYGIRTEAPPQREVVHA